MSTLRKWFGPSQSEVWTQLAQEIGGQHTPHSFWSGQKVQVQHGEWTITLDKYVVTTGKSTAHFTRLRAPFVNQDGFSFAIYRKNFLTGLAKWMGLQDVEVGHQEFDDQFVIQGNDEKQLRAFFANAEIRRLITAQPSLILSVRGDQGWFSRIYPEGVDELYFHVGGTITDLERLRGLFELFALALDQLCRIGSAYEDDPGVK